MPIRRFSNVKVVIAKTPRRIRRKSKKKSKNVKFLKGTKKPNYGGHKEPRQMTEKQIKIYMANCVENPWRYLK